jgi:hypothetical protein
MNVQQMLSHLAGGMEIVMRGEPLGKSPPGPARPVLKFIALRAPVPWPHGMKSVRDPAGVVVPEADFQNLRARVIAALDAMGSWEKRPDGAPHPAFGDLTTREWQCWAYRHADHHLKQFDA